MSKAVIFMPYDPKANLYDQVKIEYGGGEYHKNKKVKEFLAKGGMPTTVVWYDGKKNAAMSSLDTGHIFVRGHGMPGEEGIKGLKGGGEYVTYEMVYTRLKESGLSKSFSGVVHCYNCHSAEYNKQSGGVYGEPYAVRFANYMYTHGYKSCTYVGYLGALDSFPKLGSQGETTYAREKVVTVVDGRSKMLLAELGTWDQARVTIHPTIDMRTRVQKVKAFFGR